MIEAIREIGEKILKDASFLESLALNVTSKQKGKKKYIVIIEFDTLKDTINFDFEEIKEETSKRYLWVGNAISPNDPQDRFTTDNLEYLVSQTVPNFIKSSLCDGKLKILLEKLMNKFYYDLGPQKGQKERYRYVWNIEELGISSKTMKQLIEEAKGDAKKLSKIISNEIFAHLKRKKALKKKDISLFTLKVDGQLVVNLSEYRKHIENSMIPDFGRTKGICYLCQKKKEITQDMTKFDFKYYITDKIGFSSELQKDGFLKNFTLCKDCYKKLLVGESFVKNNLKDYLAGTNFYIIPKFIFNTSFSIDVLKKWAQYIKTSFNSVISSENLIKFQNELQDYPEFARQKNNFILNFLFYKKSQSEFKVLKLIKDVPPSRLDILREKESKVYDIAVRLLGENNRWDLSLGKMYYLFPVRKSKIEVVDYKKVLEFYDCLFSSKPVSYRFLIEQFAELACVYRFEKFDNYNIDKPDDSDIGLIYAILEANLLLLYLKKLNLLKGGGNMDVNKIDLGDEIKEYVKEMGYSEPKTAVFLLGYLIGEVANAQFKKGGTKPILNKITYQGMNTGKIIRLTGDIFEKLKQYDKLSYNEERFAQMKILLDKHIGNWNLSDQENVFYILSGYAYNTHKSLTEGKQKKESKDKNEEVKE